MQECVLSIDIGGTKVAGGLVETSDQGDPLIVHKQTVPFNKGKEALKDSVETLLKSAEKWGKKNKVIVHETICVGTAGNVDPKNPVVLAGSAVNLGTYPEEFDNTNMKELIEEAVDKNYNVKVCNDGCCQLAGGVRHILNNPEQKASILKKKVAYIGPGTGLGGAFGIVTDNGLDYYTDGHIYDMEILNYKHEPIFAEGIFSGTGFLNVNNITAKEVNDSPSLLKEYAEQIDHLGDYLYQICKNIYEGKFKKCSNYPWSAADYAAVKGTKIFFMGGSIGTRGSIAERIITIAQEKLMATFKTKFLFYKIPDPEKAAISGAALFFNLV